MIGVLEPDVSDEQLEEIRRQVEAIGGTCEFSRGEQQVIIVFSESLDVRRLEQALAGWELLDLIPLLPGREYRRLRARRRLTTSLAIALGLLTLVAVCVPIVSFLLPPAEALSAPNLVRAASVGQIPENTARPVPFHGQPVLLVHWRDEHYFALRALCTYVEACQLEWDPARRQLVCPCHGCAFDIYGNVVQGPPSVPLVSYEVVRLGEGIFISRKG